MVVLCSSYVRLMVVSRSYNGLPGSSLRRSLRSGRRVPSGGGHKHKRGHIASTNFSSRANLRRRASRMARPFFDDFAAVAAAMVLRSKRTFACMLGPRYLRVRSCAVVASRASTCRDLWACAYRCTHTRLHTCVESVRGHGGGVGASGRAHGSGVDPPARKARSGEVARLSATRREGAMRRDSMGVTGNP